MTLNPVVLTKRRQISVAATAFGSEPFKGASEADDEVVKRSGARVTAWHARYQGGALGLVTARDVLRAVPVTPRF